MRIEKLSWWQPLVAYARAVPGWMRDAMLLVLVLGIPGVWYSSRWLGLFPLIEFRQQASWELPFSWLWDQITLDGPNIWSVPFYFNGVVGRICGASVPCTNTLLLSLNLITATLLYFLVRRLAPWRLLAAAASSIWLLSIPVLDSMSWQATNLDKLSALLVLVGVHVGLSFQRRSYSLERCLVGNGLLLVIVMLAQNCKPAAWVLVPALVLLVVIPGGQSPWTWWRYLLAPATYAVFQSVHVLQLIRADAFYTEHVSGGDIALNVRTDLAYLTGLSAPSTAAIVAAVALLTVVVIGLVRRAPHARAAGWAGIVLVGSLAIPSRAIYPSAFYLVVPAALFALLVALAVVVATEVLPARWRVIPIAVLMLLGMGYLGNISETRHQYDVLEVSSANFRAALPTIAAQAPRTRGWRLALVFDGENPVRYRFAPEAVERFIYGNDTSFDRRISAVAASQVDMAHPPPKTSYAVFDSQLHLERIIVGPAHRPPS